MKKQHELLLSRASEQGFEVADESNGEELKAILRFGNQVAHIVNGSPRSLINPEAEVVFDHKQNLKPILSELNIPHPQSVLFRSKDDPLIDDFIEDGRLYVCKPPDLTEGEGVVLNISSREEISDYFEMHKKLSSSFMLEEMVSGGDLRIQVLDGKICASCTREPAYIVGDGTHSVLDLATKYRSKVKALNPSNELVLNFETESILHEQSTAFSTIPEKGRKIYLSKLANMSLGARAIDQSDVLHPKFHRWTEAISKRLNSGYFALDFMVNGDVADENSEANLIEINARPEWLHHTFSEGRQHDLARQIIDLLKSH